MRIDEAEWKQEKFNGILHVLSDYTPRDVKHMEAKNELLDNAKSFYKSFLKGFKNGISPLNYDNVVEEQVRYEEEEKNIRSGNGLIAYKKFGRLIELTNRDING